MSNRLFFLISSTLCAAGALTYCIMNNIIIFRGFSVLKKEQQVVQSFHEQKKKITLFFFKNNNLKQETETIVLTKDNQENCIILINRWLSLLIDEALIPFRIAVQSASYDITGKKLILSFEQSFLNSTDPVFKKLMTIEALLKTIRENIPQIQELYLLVNHRPLHDEHIDTAHAWPVHGFTHL